MSLNPTSDDPEPTRPVVDVCICTHRRPRLLARLLDSIAAQETEDAFDCRVHVADNDPAGSAQPVVDEFRGRHAIPVRYVVQPEPNISLTRNASLQGADGDYIAFIDDDEHASPRWLLSYLRYIQSSGADGLFGPIERHFADGVGRFYRTTGVFDQPNPPTGSADFVFITGNAFIRRTLLDDLDSWFDPAYGVSGGEDTELFTRASVVAGKRFLWCRDALVYEYIPRERARLAWLLPRHFRSGVLTAAIFDRYRKDALAERYQALPRLIPYKLMQVFEALAVAPRDLTPLATRVIEAAYLAGKLAYLAGLRPGHRAVSRQPRASARRSLNRAAPRSSR